MPPPPRPPAVWSPRPCPTRWRWPTRPTPAATRPVVDRHRPQVVIADLPHGIQTHWSGASDDPRPGTGHRPGFGARPGRRDRVGRAWPQARPATRVAGSGAVAGRPPGRGPAPSRRRARRVLNRSGRRSPAPPVGTTPPAHVRIAGDRFARRTVLRTARRHRAGRPRRRPEIRSLTEPFRPRHGAPRPVARSDTHESVRSPNHSGNAAGPGAAVVRTEAHKLVRPPNGSGHGTTPPRRSPGARHENPFAHRTAPADAQPSAPPSRVTSGNRSLTEPFRPPRGPAARPSRATTETRSLTEPFR